mgnify:CR=1 FL=1
MMQTLSILVCSLVGAACGAILLGDFTSLPWTIIGAVLGLVVGWLLGKFIPLDPGVLNINNPPEAFVLSCSLVLSTSAFVGQRVVAAKQTAKVRPR